MNVVHCKRDSGFLSHEVDQEFNFFNKKSVVLFKHISYILLKLYREAQSIAMGDWINIQYTILVCQSRTSPEVIYLYVISFRHNYLLRHYWTDKTVACEKQNFQEILAIKNIHFIITLYRLKCIRLRITKNVDDFQ